jgi:hypothetical protein
LKVKQDRCSIFFVKSKVWPTRWRVWASLCPERSSGADIGSYGLDTNWYTDCRATDHIMGELAKLRDCYNKDEQIHTVNGASMDIRYVGHSLLRTPTHDLHLKNILHAPN